MDMKCQYYYRDQIGDKPIGMTIRLPYIPRIGEHVTHANHHGKVIKVHYSTSLGLIEITLED